MSLRISWPRIARTGTILLVFGSTLASAPLLVHAYKSWRESVRESFISPLPASESEFQAILDGVLSYRRYEGVPPPPPEPGATARVVAPRQLLLVDRSLAMCEANADEAKNNCMMDSDPELFLMRGVDYQQIPLRLRRELAAENVNNRQVPDLRLQQVRKVSRAEVDMALSAPGWWDAFYNKFPDTAGFAEVTWPVLSEDRAQALIYVAHHCDGLCGSGALYLLHKDKEAWEVLSFVTLWMS